MPISEQGVPPFFRVAADNAQSVNTDHTSEIPWTVWSEIGKFYQVYIIQCSGDFSEKSFLILARNFSLKCNACNCIDSIKLINRHFGDQTSSTCASFYARSRLNHASKQITLIYKSVINNIGINLYQNSMILLTKRDFKNSWVDEKCKIQYGGCAISRCKQTERSQIALPFLLDFCEFLAVN